MKAAGILFFAFIITCTGFSQNTSVIDEKSGKSILIGVCTKEAFADSTYSWWFESEYKNYTVDSIAFETDHKFPEDVRIIVVLGTWCSDSRREVPRFIKILEYLDAPCSTYTLISVDRKKHGIDAETDSLRIELVPTFIFYRNGIEIGRIVETPKESLEKDILKIAYKKE